MSGKFTIIALQGTNSTLLVSKCGPFSWFSSEQFYSFSCKLKALKCMNAVEFSSNFNFVYIYLN